MSIDELEEAALKLKPEGRARLAEKLLDSLENLSDAENSRLWTEEAERRSVDWDKDPNSGRAADAVFRDAKSRLSE
jgi:putative addiction module component (TIGR02574 family)